MTTPNLLLAIYSLLTTCATPLALFCFIVAGIQLRNEGGVNISSSGSFFKYIAWGAVFLTIPQIISWLGAEGLTGIAALSTSYTPTYTTMISKPVSDFVNNVVLAVVVPVMAGALLLKSFLDAGEGHSPFPSIIAALFLLGVGGFATTATGWNDSTNLATVDILSSMLNWAMTSVAPVLAAMWIYGAILQYIRGGDWLTPLFVAAGLLVLPALWTLIQGWAGVTTGITINATSTT